MTVRIAKQPVNIREKLSELERPIGLKGSELMRSETAQDARDFVSAGRKNLIINGDMRIAQRSTTASTTGSTFAPISVDRISLGAAGSGHSTYTAEQSSDAPDGFQYSFKVTTTSAVTLGSNGYQRVNYPIEGYIASQIGYGKSWSKSITLSFWVKSNNPGNFSLAFNTSGTTNRFHSVVYTIEQSGVWEYKTITIPGDSVNYSQNVTNGIGLYLSFALRASSNWVSTNNNNIWVNQTDTSRHYGHNVNVGSVNGDYWAITGVQLEVGKNATEFEHRSYGEELALCQRYFYKLGGAASRSIGFAYTPSTSEIAVTTHHPVPMRIDPGVSLRDDTFASITPNYFRFRYEGNNNFVLPSSGVGIIVSQMTTEGGSFWFNGMSHGLTKSGELRTNEINAGEAYVAFNSEL